jgi:hypothetical protein
MTRPREKKIQIFKFLNLIFFNFFILEKIEERTKSKGQKANNP